MILTAIDTYTGCTKAIKNNQDIRLLITVKFSLAIIL